VIRRNSINAADFLTTPHGGTQRTIQQNLEYQAMTKTLSGKAAVITGAGAGIGRGVALALGKRGASVAAVGRSKENIADTAAQIRELGSDAASFICDVKNGSRIIETVNEIVSRFGRIDILVNNAQQAPLGRLLEITDHQLAAGCESGPLASFRFMKACHPHLARSGEGVIFNFTSSAAVRWDMSGYGAYGAVKAMVRQLTRAAAAEWGVDGIRAITIAPHAASSGLKTWMANNPEEAEAFFRTIPLRRIGRCEEDIGEAIAALCGPEFAYLTGATIPLDGGQANFD
jgi:NAD(P)-dependent dehydrogenase (short-subunit alcohol dehydrogenase family)